MELAFSYESGGALPEAKQFQVRASEPVKLTIEASDPWFKVTPGERTGNGPVSVQVNPEKLNAGEYSGVVMVSATDRSINPSAVRIRLSVQPPRQKPAEKAETAEKKPAEKTESVEKKLNLQKQEKKSEKTFSAVGDPGKKSPTETPVPVVNEPPKDLPVATPEPALEPAVDCRASDYVGLVRGSFKWAGVLGPQQSLTIDRHSRVTSGQGGRVTGEHLPGCDVTVTAHGGITVAVPPSAANHFGSITIKNPTDAPVNGPRIDWKIK